MREAGEFERLAQRAQPGRTDRLECQPGGRAIVLIPSDRRSEHALTRRYQQYADQCRDARRGEHELHVDEERRTAAVVDARLDALGEKGAEKAVRGARE